MNLSPGGNAPPGLVSASAALPPTRVMGSSLKRTLTAGLALALIAASTAQAGNLAGDLLGTPGVGGAAQPLQTATAAALRASWPDVDWPDNALVTYSRSGGLRRGFDKLIVYRDRTASVYWSGYVPGCDPLRVDYPFCWQTGWSSFVVTTRTMSDLIRQLEQVAVRRLGKDRPRPARDAALVSVTYKGVGVPGDGYPAAGTAIRALGRAEAILDRMFSTHRPPASAASAPMLARSG